jgi:hypothetical protein
VPLLAGGALLSGAGMMLGISVWESALQRHIPGETLSRVSSYDWFGSLAFSPLGLAIWGPVAAAIGISVSLWLAFGLSVAVLLAQAVTIHCRSELAKCSARCAEGSAIFTIVASRTTISCAVARIARIVQRLE